MSNEKPKHLNVLLVAFSPVVREGLKSFMAEDQNIKIIADADNEQEALARIRWAAQQGWPLDVVLTETRINSFDGIKVTQLIKDEFPELAIIALTENSNDSNIIDAIHAGANGYIFLKGLTPEELIKSIWDVIEGGTQINAKLLKTAVDDLLQNGRKTLAERTVEAAHLTEREVDVVRLLGGGQSNKQIAESLGITLDTTKKHVRNVIAKLQAHGRTQAALIAAQAGIVGTKSLSINGPRT
jgi:DNA-binding NarL/FixJ family response regulator